MAEERVKTVCDTCGYKSFPQWLNDEAHCLKCQAVLKRRAGVHGHGGYDERLSPGHVADKDLRVSGEVSTYKESAGSAMESVSGSCAKSPDGQHHWKFGKCNACGKAEGKLIAPGGAPGECAKGGKCTFKFAKCSKCGRGEGQTASPRAASPRPAPAAAKAGGSLRPPAAGGDARSASPRPKSPAPPQSGSSPRPASPRPASPRPASPRPAPSGGYNAAPAAAAPKAPSGGGAAEERVKTVCDTCGYKSFPQWLNDEAHCLKCQAVLKRRAGVHGENDFDTRVCPGNVADKDRRAPGEASTYKESPGSAMESKSGTCAKSPDGAHNWKFGKCSYCQAPEAKLGKGGGAAANPGGRGADCSKGGKCTFKFTKCTKCGKVE